MTLNDKIVLAVAKILDEGIHRVTGYRIGKTLGLDASCVYKQLNIVKKGK